MDLTAAGSPMQGTNWNLERFLPEYRVAGASYLHCTPLPRCSKRGLCAVTEDPPGAPSTAWARAWQAARVTRPRARAW
mgnify:CR=1 FL=1